MTDVIVIGAGAAGLMCAAVAARQGKRVHVLESNNRAGAKIRISGGGRCNFTNREVTHHNFISRNPDFCRSALTRYTPHDFISLVDSYNIAWHEKTLGQLFCDGSAQQIIDMLLAECALGDVHVQLNAQVQSVRYEDDSRIGSTSSRTDDHENKSASESCSRFVVNVNGKDIETRSVVVACGGLSIPTLGASDLGYRIARAFSVPLVPTFAALVPFTFGEDWKKVYTDLAGVSVDATVESNTALFREHLLFTHRGLSGPAILQASSYWEKGAEIRVNLLPDHDSESLLPAAGDKRHMSTILSEHLPQRLIQVWNDPRLHQPANSFAKNQQVDIIKRMQSWAIKPTGTEGYAKAEVTRGGVDTTALSQKTMECKSVPGLYFIGEVVDVTGWLGGYNFQWAWASGVAAGTALSQSV
ncbi:MAG: NAD(P)/FAD-dependent oxidoreductase [bacterium]|nr:NAD(P)/FAD-dependent oxidoreductase [bacterium]